MDHPPSIINRGTRFVKRQYVDESTCSQLLQVQFPRRDVSCNQERPSRKLPKEWYDPSQRSQDLQDNAEADERAGTCWGFTKGKEPVFANFSNGWDDKYTRDGEENEDDDINDDDEEDEDEDEDEDKNEDQDEDDPEPFDLRCDRDSD